MNAVPSGHAPVSIVDGNAVAGMLTDVLAGDPTRVELTCGHCAARVPLAETVVEREPTSAIVRCRTCTHTLLTLLDSPEAIVVRVGGLELRIPRGSGAILPPSQREG